MYRIRRFKFDEKVSGNTLDGTCIIGQYKGIRASYGCLIYGLPKNKQKDPNEMKAMYICLTLSVKSLEPNRKATTRKHDKHVFHAGDPCQGVTRTLEKIEGEFQNMAGDYAYVRGHVKGTNKLSPKQAFKVRRDTLTKM